MSEGTGRQTVRIDMRKWAREQADLCVIYAEDGAYHSAAREARRLADVLQQHADRVNAVLRPAAGGGMSEGRIHAEGSAVMMAPIQSETGVTLGWKVAECENEPTAAEIARRCEMFKVLLTERDAAVKALSFTLRFAREAWMKAANNAPQGEAAYQRWAAMPEWIALDQGVKAAEAAVKVTEVAP